MTLQKKATKGLVWSFLERWGGQLISTSIFLVLARLLGPETFGLVALASVFIAFMTAFVNQGFAPAIVQKEELSDKHLNTAFWSSLSIGSVLFIATIASAGLIAQLFGEPDLKPVIRWLSVTFLFIALESVQVGLLQRGFAFKKLAIRSLLSTAISGVVSLIMALLGFGVWSLVAQQLINRGVNVLVLWKASTWRPGRDVSFEHFKELSSFGVNVMGVNILRFFNQRSDDFLIGYFLGTTALGYYTVAYRLLRLMVNILTNTTVSVALPAFSRLQSKPAQLRNAFYKATQLTSFISFPAFTAVLLLAPQFVEVLFGENWSPSIPIMQVLVFAGILQSVSYFNGTVMLAKGKPSWRLFTNFLNAILNVGGFIVAVRYGIVAVAIAVAVSGYIVMPVSLTLIRKLTDIKISQYFRQYLGPLAGSVAMGTVIALIKQVIAGQLPPLAILIICSTAGLVIYLGIITTVNRDLSKRVITLVKHAAR